MTSDHEPSARRYGRFFRADPVRDVNEELEFHLAMRAEEFERAGMTADEARAAVMQRFGDMESVRSEVEHIAVQRHARRRRAWRMETVRQDLRFAIRTLVANPGFTIVVAITLALGIGANAAVFSVAYGVLLRPLPYRDADELVRVWSKNARRNLPFFSVAPADYLDWKRDVRGFTAMAAYERQRDATVATSDLPMAAPLAAVTPDLFPLLGARPAIGRWPSATDAERGAAPVVVMSNSLWTTQFGADPHIIGRELTIDGEKRTVIAVMPARFSVPGSSADLWVPLSLEDAPKEHNNRYLRVLGRRAPGVSVERANMELDVVAQRIAREFPSDAGEWSTNVMSVNEMIVGRQFKRATVMLVGVVAFVLIIACANAANLQLARGAAREREMAVRAALGASRGRIARQLVTESIVISCVAYVAGLLLAFGGVSLLRAVGTTSVPRLDDVKLDAPVLVFTMLVTLGSALLFGVLPALRVSRADAGEVLKGARGALQSAIGARVRGALVVTQIALSLVLLIGAGLLMRSFVRLRAVDVGFNERNLAVVPLRLPRASYPSPASTNAFYEATLDRLAHTDGNTGAAFVSSAPFAGANSGTVFLRMDESLPANTQPPDADFRVSSPGYFKVMGIPLIRGRDFSRDDRQGAPDVVIINAAMSKKYWPNGDAIGNRIRIGDVVKGPVATIVGVVGDARYQSVETDDVHAMMYFPLNAHPQQSMMLVTRSSPERVESTVRSVLQSIDKRLPVPATSPMSQLVSSAMSARSFALTLFGVFAVVSLLLSAVGLYGVLSFLVRQRTHELGIRVALGAPRGRLLLSVVAGALRLTGAGIAIGLIGAYLLRSTLGSLLFGVSSTDGLTFAALPILLALVAVLASLVPALRATRADPLAALRGET